MARGCTSRAVFACALLACAGAGREAHARVQNSAQTQIGVVGVGREGRAWDATRLNLGARVESIWGREGPRDFGVGPYVEARTASFSYGEYGGGVVALLPVEMTFPLWFGGGGFARREHDRWAPGFNGFLAWGGRSFNHHSSYAMAYGLLLDARAHRGDTPGFDLVLTATIDLQGLALPWLYAVSAVRH